ncbi:MAG: hypothetical protein P0121_03260 [Nitrospira sp.]|nr:hypothetical protein [Nitrospira sp.]
MKHPRTVNEAAFQTIVKRIVAVAKPDKSNLARGVSEAPRRWFVRLPGVSNWIR